MKLAAIFTLLQAADSLSTGKDQVSESIDSLTMLIMVVAALGVFLIIRIFIRQSRRKGEQS